MGQMSMADNTGLNLFQATRGRLLSTELGWARASGRDSSGPAQKHGAGGPQLLISTWSLPLPYYEDQGPSLYPHWRNSPPCGPLVVLGTSGHSALFSVLYCGSLSLLRTFISLCLHSSASTCFRNSVSSSSWYSEQTNLLSGYDTRPLDCGHRDAVMSQTRPVFTCSETDCSLP